MILTNLVARMTTRDWGSYITRQPHNKDVPYRPDYYLSPAEYGLLVISVIRARCAPPVAALLPAPGLRHESRPASRPIITNSYKTMAPVAKAANVINRLWSLLNWLPGPQSEGLCLANLCGSSDRAARSRWSG